jgi:voltage-gated potassium channel
VTLRHHHLTVLRVTEPAILVAAIASVPLTMAETGHSSVWLYVADWLIWAVFVVAFLALVVTAPNRGAYLKRDWLTVAIILVSFPALPSAFGITRVLRLLRLAALTARAVPAVRAVFGRLEVVYLAFVTVFVIVVAGAALSLMEPSLHGDFWAGLWWAVVTATTVGYGDISPSTLPGRLVAVVLMFVGIGLTSTLAAAVAAYFVSHDRKDEHAELVEKLDRLEQLLGAREEAADAGSG